MEQPIPTFPVCGLETGLHLGTGAIILRLDYLVSDTTPLDQPHRSPRFLLSATVAQDLIALLQTKLDQQRNAGLPGK